MIPDFASRSADSPIHINGKPMHSQNLISAKYLTTDLSEFPENSSNSDLQLNHLAEKGSGLRCGIKSLFGPILLTASVLGLGVTGFICMQSAGNELRANAETAIKTQKHRIELHQRELSEILLKSQRVNQEMTQRNQQILRQFRQQ